jgi:hypothetical protein
MSLRRKSTGEGLIAIESGPDHDANGDNGRGADQA